MDHRDYLTQSYSKLVRMATQRCRAKRLPERIDDFVGWLDLKLCTDDYRRAKRIMAADDPDRYLAKAVKWQWHDFLDSLFGKFVNCKFATMTGPHACKLETRLVRDDYTLEEAIETVLDYPGYQTSRGELLSIYRRLPRHRRRKLVAVDEPEQLEAPADPEDDPIVAAELRERAEEIADVYDEALAALSPEERYILKQFVQEGLTAKEIALTLGLPSGQIYKRKDKAREKAFEYMTLHGVTRDDVLQVTGQDWILLDDSDDSKSASVE